jgi:hypothetical protein
MEYRYEGHALNGSQSFVCRESRKSAAMIKGSLYICDDYCATSCDAESIANVPGFFSFANPSRFFFLSQNLQIFGLALRKKAQYVVVCHDKNTICDYTIPFFRKIKLYDDVEFYLTSY